MLRCDASSGVSWDWTAETVYALYPTTLITYKKWIIRVRKSLLTEDYRLAYVKRPSTKEACHWSQARKVVPTRVLNSFGDFC